MITTRSKEEINLLREANRIAARVLQELGKMIKPGITTKALEKVAEEMILTSKAKPAFKGYRGFPSCICTSIDEEVVHGIPSDSRVIKEGDIVSIDVGVKYKGYYGDAAATFPCGKISEEKEKLIKVTKEALKKGIEQARCGKRLYDISSAIQRHVEGHGFSVVRDFVGHGIGTSMHEEPQVPNFGQANYGPKLEPGMVLSLEPMVNMGTSEVKILDDNWTAVTKDGNPSAHFEDTIAITEGEPELLTVP